MCACNQGARNVGRRTQTTSQGRIVAAQSQSPGFIPTENVNGLDSQQRDLEAKRRIIIRNALGRG